MQPSTLEQAAQPLGVLLLGQRDMAQGQLEASSWPDILTPSVTAASSAGWSEAEAELRQLLVGQPDEEETSTITFTWSWPADEGGDVPASGQLGTAQSLSGWSSDSWSMVDPGTGLESPPPSMCSASMCSASSLSENTGEFHDCLPTRHQGPAQGPAQEPAQQEHMLGDANFFVLPAGGIVDDRDDDAVPTISQASTSIMAPALRPASAPPPGVFQGQLQSTLYSISAARDDMWGQPVASAAGAMEVQTPGPAAGLAAWPAAVQQHVPDLAPGIAYPQFPLAAPRNTGLHPAPAQQPAQGQPGPELPLLGDRRRLYRGPAFGGGPARPAAPAPQRLDTVGEDVIRLGQIGPAFFPWTPGDPDAGWKVLVGNLPVEALEVGGEDPRMEGWMMVLASVARPQASHGQSGPANQPMLLDYC